jgi:hypothetical protein
MINKIMPIYFNDFASDTTIRSTDYFVGYANINSGGERRWTYSTLLNQLNTTFRNKLINAQGLINQRVYVSGTATTAANQYTVDRWRVVTSGQNLAFSTTANAVTFTAPAGGVEQVVEGLNVESGTYVLNWSGTATAIVNGTARTKGETFSLTGGSNVTVRFSSGTFSLPQLEKGTSATPFEYRPFGSELALCQRYYEKSYNLNVAPGTAEVVTSGFQGTIIMRLFGLIMNTSNGGFVNVYFKVNKMSNPTVKLYSAQGTQNAFTDLNPLAERVTLNAVSIGQFGFQPAYVGPSLVIYSPCFHYTAESEL